MPLIHFSFIFHNEWVSSFSFYTGLLISEMFIPYKKRKKKERKTEIYFFLIFLVFLFSFTSATTNCVYIFFLLHRYM